MLAEIGVAAAQAGAGARRARAGATSTRCSAPPPTCSAPIRRWRSRCRTRSASTGFGFDMNVACSSATFGIQTAADYIRAGNAQSVLVVSPEICSGHLNFRDRDSHFIFGDVATAVLVEDADDRAGGALGDPRHQAEDGVLEQHPQQFRLPQPRRARRRRRRPTSCSSRKAARCSRKSCRWSPSMIVERCRAARASSRPTLRRLWLHQANAGMNRLIAQRVLGHEASEDESPTVLDTYANTSSAGSIIAFHKHQR